MVAYEIAQQMMAQGLRVGVLALFDTHGPGYPRLRPNTNRRHYRLLRTLDRIDLHLGNFLAAEFRNKLRYVATKTGRLKHRLLHPYKQRRRQKRRAAEHQKAAFPAELRTVDQAGRKAFRLYVPRPYPGKVTLFRATKQPSGVIPDPALGWTQMARGGLEVYPIPGYHGAIVYDPRARILAERLRECLDRAQEREALQAYPDPLRLASGADSSS